MGWLETCWITCRNIVVLVLCVELLETLLDLSWNEDWSSLLGSSLSFSLEIILFTELLYLYAGNCCGFDHMFSLLKRCKYSLYSDTMLNYWSTNHCWTCNVECIFYCWMTGSCLEWNKLRMYVCTLKNIYSSRYLDTLLYKTGLNMHWNAVVYIHSQQ